MSGRAYRVVLPLLGIASYELFLLALPHRPAAIIDNVMQAVVAGCAPLGCAWFATRFSGWERAWRPIVRPPSWRSGVPAATS
jgi:hypothetical protein